MMASDPSIRDQLFSLMKSKLTSPLSFRQTGSTTTQGDGTLHSLRQSTSAFRTLSRASTSNLLTGSGEGQGDPVAGQVPSSGNPSAPAQPRSINIVLFGETGVGKSSVINLIAQKEVAKVSSDVNGCTMQSTRYDISFDGMNFSIFDTIGLEEPQMGVNGYLKAIEKAYELIVKLGAAGGIHLLLFCMRGGRITATTQSNYRLFCECLCNKKVPVALIFTGLEREDIMENWWERNKRHIEYYGINSDGHACITAVQDETPEDHKYEQSQTIIRLLLKDCALKNEAFLLDRNTWFARLGKGMRSFIEKHRSPKRKDVVKVLTRRCKLDPETARKIADMMEKGDAEKEKEKEEPRDMDALAVMEDNGAANEEAARNRPSTPSPNDVTAGPHGVELERNDKKAGQRTPALPQNEDEIQLHNVEAVGKGHGAVADENAAQHRIQAPVQGDIDAAVESAAKHRIRAVANEEVKSAVVVENAAKRRIQAPPQGDVDAQPRTVCHSGKDKRVVVKEEAKSAVVVEDVAKHRTQAPPQGNVDAQPRVVWPPGKDKRALVNEELPSLSFPYDDVEAQLHTVRPKGKHRSGVADEKAKYLVPTRSSHGVEAEPHPVGSDGQDNLKSGADKATRHRTFALQQSGLGTGSCTAGLAGRDRTGANDRAGEVVLASSRGNVEAEPGQMGGNCGEQSVKSQRGDTSRPQLRVPSSTVRSSD